MSEYYFIFVWMAVLAYISTKSNIMDSVKVVDEWKMRYNIVWALVVFLPIIHLSSMGTPRSDTWAYISAFEKSEASWSSIVDAFAEHKSGFGYKIFQDSLKVITHGNVTAFRIILALAQSLPVILVFRRYSPEYLYSTFLFVATGCHIAWMMNGIRQFLAVTIIFSGTGFIIKQRYIPAIFLILLASTFHTSALIMLPVIFIVQGKAWNKKTIWYIVAALAAMFVFSRRADIMDDLLQGTEYAGAVGNWQEMGDEGVHPLRVVVNAVPVILSFYIRKEIIKENNPVLNICVNMSIINLGLYLIAMVTSGVMIGRIPIYVSLYTYILLAYLIFTVNWGEGYTELFRKGSLVGYLLYYYLQYRSFR